MNGAGRLGHVLSLGGVVRGILEVVVGVSFSLYTDIVSSCLHLIMKPTQIRNDCTYLPEGAIGVRPGGVRPGGVGVGGSDQSLVFNGLDFLGLDLNGLGGHVGQGVPPAPQA